MSESADIMLDDAKKSENIAPDLFFTHNGDENDEVKSQQPEEETVEAKENDNIDEEEEHLKCDPVAKSQFNYSCAPQYRMSRDQQISSVIGGFSLLPI